MIEMNHPYTKYRLITDINEVSYFYYLEPDPATQRPWNYPA